MNSHHHSLLAQFPILGCNFCLWSREGGKNAIPLVRAMVMSVIIILGIQTPVFGGCAQLAIMLFDMMVFIAPAA